MAAPQPTTESSSAAEAALLKRSLTPQGTRNISYTAEQPPTHEPINEEFSRSYSTRGIRPTATENPKTTDRKKTDRRTSPRSSQTRRGINRLRRNRRKNTQTEVVDKALLLVAKRVSIIFLSIGFTFWIYVQLPFAVLSIVSLGLMGIAEQVAGGGETIQNLANAVGLTLSSMPVIGSLFEVGSTVIDAGLQAVGITDSASAVVLIPFLISTTVVLALGWGQILALYIIYKLLGFEPFSGRAAGAKHNAVLLAFIGYAIPVLNLAPWFIRWVLVMRKHPK